MLDIKCPDCERQLQLPEDAVERPCKCPACGAVFAWAQLPRKHHSPARPSEGSITETEPFENEDYDVEVMAERARLLRDMDDERLADPEPFASELRWNEGISAAKKGFGIGLAAGLVLLFASSFSRGNPDQCGQVWLSVGVGLLGMMHRFLIVFLSHALGPRHRVWTQKLLISILTLWIIGVFCLQWWSNPFWPIGVDILAFALGTGLAALIFLWVLVAGFMMLGGTFRK